MLLNDPFADPAAVARYAETVAQRVPGLADLHRMAAVLLAERAPADARVLVVGAGGGMELAAFARAHPGWRFVGVDPSPPMLDLARATLGPLAERVELIEGTVDAAGSGFDAATCLLVLHFLTREQRLETLRAIRRRLRPGAALVIAHHSFADADADLWLGRFAAYTAAAGVPVADAETMRTALRERLPVLAPAEEEALLHEAGFADAALFWAALTFRGWVARA